MRSLLPTIFVFIAPCLVKAANPTAFEGRLGTSNIVSCTATGNNDVCHLLSVTLVNRDLAGGGTATVVEGQRSDTTGNFSFRQILTAQGVPNVVCTESPDTAVCNFEGNAQTATARTGPNGNWQLDIVSAAGGKPLQVHLLLKKQQQ